jgi:DNA-binding response OmpR family regulator
MTDAKASNPLALIVEDDEKLAVIFTQAVKQAAFDVETARHGREALEKISHLTPALVVLDLHLPDISGATILQRIRQAPHLAHVQVILATADPAMADSLEAQSDLVLIKPVSFTQLRDLAARLRTQMV